MFTPYFSCRAFVNIHKDLSRFSLETQREHEKHIKELAEFKDMVIGLGKIPVQPCFYAMIDTDEKQFLTDFSHKGEWYVLSYERSFSKWVLQHNAKDIDGPEGITLLIETDSTKEVLCRIKKILAS